MKKIYKNYKKIYIGAFLLVGFIIFYMFFGFFAVPWAIKSVLPKFIADKNATFNVEDIRFNPFKSELNATKISLKTYSDLFSAKKLDVKLNLGKILLGDINVDILRLEEPKFNIEREKNLIFNFDNLISNDIQESNKKSNNNIFFNVSLNKFQIINGNLKFIDRSLKYPFNLVLNDLNYQISNLNLKKFDLGKHLVNVNSNLFKQFHYDGKISLNPLKISGNLNFNGLKIDEIFQSYLDKSDLNITQGIIDASLVCELTIDNNINFDTNNSQIKARDFNIADKNTTINFEEFGINNLNLAGNFGKDNQAKIILSNIFVKNFKNDFGELAYFSANDFVSNFKEDENLSFFGNVSSIQINGAWQNLDTKFKLDKALINDLKYDMNKKLDVSFLDFEDFRLKMTIPSLKFEKLVFKNPSFDIQNELFYINNFYIDSKNKFNNLQIDIGDFVLQNSKFNGFGLGILNDNLTFLDSNISLASEQNSTKMILNLENINVSPTQINIKNKKIAVLNNVDINGFAFKDNNLKLSSLILNQINLFSYNKNFCELKDLFLNDMNFDLNDKNFNIKDVGSNYISYSDEFSQHGLKYVNNIISLSNGEKNRAKKKTTDSDKLAINIDNTEILRANLNIKQNFLNKPLKHKILIKDMKINGFSNVDKKKFFVSSNLLTDEKIAINIKGKMRINPLNIELDTKINSHDLTRLNKIVTNYLNAEISKGKISMNSKLKFAKNFSLTGNFAIDDFELKDMNSTKIFSVDKFDVRRIFGDENGLNLQNLIINNPFLKAHIYKDRSINLSDFVKKNENNESSERKNENQDAKFNISLENIEFNNSNIDFSDDSLILPFVFGIKNLNAKIDKIENNTISQIYSQGLIGSGGSANVNVKMDFFNPKNSSDISLKFKDVELNEITPYSATFLGRKIDNGLLDLSLRYAIKDGKMDGENNIIINNIMLGESVKSDSAVSLPLQLAVSILRDSNNIIDLNLPVSGDLDNPSFSYGSIIWQAVKQLFVDVVSSPFRLLGKALGLSNADELSGVDFEAGRYDIMASQSKKIANFKNISDNKKDIIFVITPSFDKDIDTFALQKQALDREILYIAKSKTSKFDAINLMAMQRLKNPSKDPYNDLAKLKKISQKDLENLALKRAENLSKAMLKAGISKSQLRIDQKFQSVKAKLELYVAIQIGIENKH